MPAPLDAVRSIFHNRKIESVLDETAALRKPLDSGAYARDFELEGNGQKLELLEEVAQLDASLAVEARFFAVGEEPDNPFGTGEPMPLPAGKTVASRLVVDLAASINGKALAKPTPGVTLSARASAGKGLSYELLLPQEPGIRRLTGIKRLLARTDLPHRLDLPSLARGEVHALRGSFSYDLGLDFDAGYQTRDALVTDLFRDSPLELKLKADAVVSASLGLAGYGRRSLVVGRAAASEEGADRVRIRIWRERERRFTFAAMMSVQIDWDLGSSLEKLLEVTFDSFTLPDVVESMREVVDQAAAGSWEAIEMKLSDKAKGLIAELFARFDLDDWLSDSTALDALTEGARKLVEAYDELDEEAQSFWDHFLGTLGAEAELEKVATLLDRVIDLGGEGQEGLLARILAGEEDARKLLDVLQMLSGRDLEELLLARASELDASLQRATGLAQRIKGFLDDTPPAVVSRLADFVARTGIARVVAALAEHAQSPEQIEELLLGRVKRVAEKLLDRAWGDLDESDLERLEQWAKKAKRLLDAPGTIEERLRENAKRLRGQVGFSVGIELDRLERHSALLDVELDRDAKLLARVSRELAKGDIAGILASLAEDLEGDGEPDDEAELPVTLREAVFTSSRIRSSAISTFASFAGLGRKGSTGTRRVRQRFDESILRVERVGNAFRRSGTYTGGFSYARMHGKNETRTAVLLESVASGKGPDIREPYRDGWEKTLRLTLFRRDEVTGQDELVWITQALAVFGFEARFAADAPFPTARSVTQFSVDVRFPEAAVEALVDDLGTSGRKPNPADPWNVAFLRAGHRYFAEPLIDKVLHVDFGRRTYEGNRLLPAVLESPQVRSAWTERALPEFLRKTEAARLRPPGEDFAVSLGVGGGRIAYRIPFQLIDPLRSKRQRGLRAMRRFRDALEAAAEPKTASASRPHPTHFELVELSAEFARASRRNAVVQGAWPSTMFQAWWVLARIATQAPELLRDARGVATMRWLPEGSGSDDLRGPLIWRTREGVGIPDPVPRVFPI